MAQRIDYYPFDSPFSDSLSFVFTYQNKEYINFFGFNSFDFHARGLDTWTGRFSGLDPIINYSLSGYASMINNPISYIDPDGRNPLFIGAFVAIFANTAIKMAQGKSINSMWDFLKPGIAGAIGGGLGSLAPIGVLPGMAYGAGSGAVTGTINPALNGSNIGQGALYGAIGGGVFGGITGGLEANNLGANIWTGYRSPHSMFTAGNVIQGGTSVEYGAESVQNLYSENFSDLNMNGSFFTNKGKSVFPEENGSLISEGKKALAVTKSTIWKGGNYHKIYFGRNAFSSKEQLSFVLTHELGHVIHSRLNLSSLASEAALSGLLDNEGHVAIQAMTFDFLKLNGWNYLNFSSQARPVDFIGTSPYPQLMTPIKTLIRKIK